jgi:tripartite ATP-independent transporter DctM subunit
MIAVVFLILSVPVGISLGTGGFLGFILIYKGNVTLALGQLINTPYFSIAHFDYTVIPLFILMGVLALQSGMGEEIYDTTVKWFGRLRGGLAMATIMGDAAFGACTGSSAVSAALFTKISLPQMLRYNYQKSFAAGTVAGGALLGMLIPPSGLAVIYGILTETSIGKLLIGGIGPGLLFTAIWCVAIYVRARINPSLAPAADMRFTMREKLVTLKGMWGPALIGIVILGGIYSGVFTATEAAAVAAFVCFLVLTVRGKLTGQNLKAALLETGSTSCMIFMIFVGAIIFSRMLSISGISGKVAADITGSGLSPTVILLLLLAMYLVLGCFLDSISMMTLTMPLLDPIFEGLGWDPVWIGLVVICVIEMGLITPPVGLSCYVVKATAGDQVTLEEVFGGSFFFLVLMVPGMILLILFPEIITFLPNMMLGK